MATATQEQVETSTEAETAAEATEIAQQEAEKPNLLLDKNIELKAKPLTMSRFQLAEEKRNVWRVEVEMGTTVEQILEEGFWANVGSLLRAGDEIQVLPDNYAWRLDLHVAGAGRMFAHVVKMNYFDLVPTTAAVKVPSIYKVEFMGAHYKWRVLRKGEPLQDGFETESLARRFVVNHEKAVNR